MALRAATANSGQFMCYKTGQFYLLTTHDVRYNLASGTPCRARRRAHTQFFGWPATVFSKVGTVCGALAVQPSVFAITRKLR